MNTYKEWDELLHVANAPKLDKWIEFYHDNDPTFADVMEFCRTRCADIDDLTKMKLAVVVLCFQKTKKATEEFLKQSSSSPSESNTITCSVCGRTLPARMGDKGSKCTDCVWFRRKKIDDPCWMCKKPCNQWASFMCAKCEESLID